MERRFAAKHLHGAEPAAETMPDPFDFYLSSPIVANGLVYFGSGDTNIYALDAATGALKWKFKTNGAIHSTVTHHDGVIYFGSFDGNYYALNLTERLGVEKTGGLLRIGLVHYNTAEEVDRLLVAMRELASST